ncbi:MAG: FHA domain-containing serine/threonine-protein kinase [Thermoanaerobaculia bacterium]
MRVRIAVDEGPNQGTSFSFDSRDRLFVGRAREAQLSVDADKFFSRFHLVIEVNPPNVYLRDLGSTNGTFVNGSPDRVKEALLKGGDRVLAGRTVLRIEVDDPFSSDVQKTTLLGDASDRHALRFLDLIPMADGDVRLRHFRRRVRCFRCGVRAEQETPRPDADVIAFYCAACRATLLDRPPVVPNLTWVKRVGQGALGAVHLMTDAAGAQRAVKIVLPRAAVTRGACDLFIAEAARHATMRHPRILRVDDCVEIGPGIIAVVMEYVDAPSAAELMRRTNNRPLPPGPSVEIAIQTLQALAHAHRSGFVHTDVRPAQLLLRRDAAGGPAVKLKGFGLAWSFQACGASGFAQLGQAPGALRYLAPEQILSVRRAAPESDQYAVAVTLTKLLTGELPHEFRSDQDDYVVILEGVRVPLRQRNPALPASLEAVLERALDRDPARRFEDAGRMADALREAMGMGTGMKAAT